MIIQTSSAGSDKSKTYLEWFSNQSFYILSRYENKLPTSFLYPFLSRKLTNINLCNIIVYTIPTKLLKSSIFYHNNFKVGHFSLLKIHFCKQFPFHWLLEFFPEILLVVWIFYFPIKEQLIFSFQPLYYQILMLVSKIISQLCILFHKNFTSPIKQVWQSNFTPMCEC